MKNSLLLLEGVRIKLLSQFKSYSVYPVWGLAPKFSSSYDAYKMIIPEDNFKVMLEASTLMFSSECGYSSFNTQTIISDTVSYIGSYDLITFSEDKHIRYLFPEKLNEITPHNEFGRLMLPVIEHISKWLLSYELINLMFVHYKPALVLALMPWLKPLLNEIDDYSYRNYITEYVLKFPKPRVIPSRSIWFNNALREGEILLTQARLFKNKNRNIVATIIIPTMDRTMIKHLYPILFNNFCEFCSTCKDFGIDHVNPGL